MVTKVKEIRETLLNVNSSVLRAAVIGLGRQSVEDHLPAIRNSSDVKLVGVVDIDENKLNAFLEENKNVKGYKNVDALLKENELDFAIVAVPHNLHYAITKKLLEHGVSVLKEKPFATSLLEAKSLKAIADHNKVKIGITMQRRFNPIYSTFFQLISI